MAFQDVGVAAQIDLPPGSVPGLKLVSALPTHQSCSVAEA